MRQISILGFDWSHVVAVGNRHPVDEVVLVTAERDDPRVLNAIEEVSRYVARIGASLRVVKAPTVDVWKCVEVLAPEFFGRPVVLDLGGGVRSLGLCAFIAASLAIELGGAEVEAVYTQAEDVGRVIPVDLRPLRFAATLRGLRPRTRREALRGRLPEGQYGRKLARELERFGLVKDGELAQPAAALARMLELA